ncbi:MAG: VWA domain-containing protein [Lachnospiraceae bacterium]|nr:VWA domain-containing protein [Lachnospiraceae bacterium]
MRIEKKLVTAILAIAFFVMLALFVFYKNADAAEDETDNSADRYIYLAECAVDKGNPDKAISYLKKLYSRNGDVPMGTLLNARIQVIKGDYAGASVLYSKLEKSGNESILSESDKQFYTAFKNGLALTMADANAVLAKIAVLKEDGKNPEDNGYSAELISACEKIAKGELDYAAMLLEEARKDIEEKEKSDPGFANLSEAAELISVINQNYSDYTKDLSHSKINVNKAAEKLTEIYGETPEIFDIPDLDEAFVKALVMTDDMDTLIDYATSTESQVALVTVAQLLVDGHISQSDLPKDFVEISTKKQREVLKQCKEAYRKVQKSVEGAELKLLNEKIDTVENMVENPALTELDTRIDPFIVPLEEQSKLLLGASTFHYAEGKTEKADSELLQSIETSTFSSDDEYASVCENIIGVVYGGDGNSNVKNVNSYLSDAYDIGVINKNPNDRSSDSDEYQEKPAKEKKRVGAKDLITNEGSSCVSKQLAMINVSSIDTSRFPEISFNIQTGKELDLDNLSLKLSDCGIIIDDFKIKKTSYNAARIYMVCDKSGSMDGSTDTLQAAVRSFASTITNREKIGLIGFSSGVDFDSGIVDDPAKLEEFIVRLQPGGGTHIASAAFAAIEKLSGKQDVFNVVILMTDGKDSSFYDENLKELREKCEANNIVLYTIGLGSSTNPEYLTNIANYGNGKFVYCTDVSALEGFYDFIHSQMEHTYTISFTAQDSFTSERVLKLTNDEDSSTTEKMYTIDSTKLDTEPTTPDSASVSDRLLLYGFKETKIIKGDSDITATIMGANFTPDTKCLVEIRGENYAKTFQAKFKDQNYFTLTIPSLIPYGKYTVTTTVTKAFFSARTVDDVKIIDGTTQTLVYGAYTFTADKIKKGTDKTVLSGNVQLGNYLYFIGDVTLDGNVETDNSVELSSQSGCYAKFENQMPGQLGEYYKDTINLGILRDLTLYNDAAHIDDTDNYMVDEISLDPVNLGAIHLEKGAAQVYPEQMIIKMERGYFNFPMLDKIIHQTTSSSMFSVEFNQEGILNSEGFFTKGKLSLGGLDNKFNFGKHGVNLSDFSLEYDTYSHDYQLSLGVSLPLAKKDINAGMSMDIGFKDGSWDSVMFHYSNPQSIYIVPNKVSLNNFSFGVSDLANEDYPIYDIPSFFCNATFKGGADVEVFNLSDKATILKEFFGSDVALITLADTIISFRYNDPVITAESNLKLFGLVDYGRCECKIGNFTYDDYLLGFSSEDVIGVDYSLSQGPEIDYPNFKLKVQGTTRVGINNLASYFIMRGDIDYYLSFRNIHESGRINGLYELAFVYGDGEDVTLNLIIREENVGKDPKGFRGYISLTNPGVGVEFY